MHEQARMSLELLIIPHIHLSVIIYNHCEPRQKKLLRAIKSHGFVVMIETEGGVLPEYKDPWFCGFMCHCHIKCDLLLNMPSRRVFNEGFMGLFTATNSSK